MRVRPRAASTLNSLVALTRVTDVDDILRVQPTLADRDGRADEGAHHAVTEGVGLDVRDQDAFGVTMPVELDSVRIVVASSRGLQ